jgi:hypothetical protein
VALFVPLLFTASFPVALGPVGERSYVFSYYAVGPLRYFGPWILGWLLFRYLRNPSPARHFWLCLACGGVALNNLDFGLSAAAGQARVPPGGGRLVPAHPARRGRAFAPGTGGGGDSARGL